MQQITLGILIWGFIGVSGLISTINPLKTLRSALKIAKFKHEFGCIMAKKISDEEELMNQSSTNLRKKSKNSKKMKTKSASRQSSQVEDYTSSEKSTEVLLDQYDQLNAIQNETDTRIDVADEAKLTDEDRTLLKEYYDKKSFNDDEDGADSTVGKVKQSEIKSIPSKPSEAFDDPFLKGVPPEVLFFGDPRVPPPAEACRDTKYHGTLLMWARHADVVPRTIEERAVRVLPKVSDSEFRLKMKLSELTFDYIVNEFNRHQDLEAKKSFISANLDLVPSKLFLRALTMQKLSAQFENNLSRMEEIKFMRNQYFLAHDQLFFPLNIEIKKAETRVMTFLAKPEMINYIEEWDDIETSLYFLAMITSRRTWEEKTKQLEEMLEDDLKDTVPYLRQAIERDMRSQYVKKPSLTASVYFNATMIVAYQMPNVYSKVLPEIKLLFELYGKDDREEILSYVKNNFCVRQGISVDQLKVKLRVLQSYITAIQGAEYQFWEDEIHLIFDALSDENELAQLNHWYNNIFEENEKKGKTPYGFETYEPDVIPDLVQLLMKYRDYKNAFTNFRVDVLELEPPKTESFSGNRKKGSDPAMQNWLERDPDYRHDKPDNFGEIMEAFRLAFLEQCELRRQAANKFDVSIQDQLQTQERIFANTCFLDPEVEEEDDKEFKFPAENSIVLEGTDE